MNKAQKQRSPRILLQHPYVGIAMVLGVAIVIALIGLSASPKTATAGEITVYKNPTCGCCKEWVRHMEQAGFRVVVHDVNDVSHTKQQYGVPREMYSCHTAVAGPYAFEGHVPADLVQRVLAERPAIAGLAVPGMPSGAPGMDGPRKQKYEVMSFTSTGERSTYAAR